MVPLSLALTLVLALTGALSLTLTLPAKGHLRRERIAVSSRSRFSLPRTFAENHTQAFGEALALHFGECAVSEPRVYENRTDKLAFLDPDGGAYPGGFGAVVTAGGSAM